jgi:hypothetical protein
MAGSTGVLPPPKGYLERLRAICDKYGILLIFDEVITGFGRLGFAFAAERYGVIPDMITFSPRAFQRAPCRWANSSQRPILAMNSSVQAISFECRSKTE